MVSEEAPRKRRAKKPLDKDHREARAGLILAAKLANKRTEEICQEFHLSRATVYRALADARRMGLLTQARDWLTLNLVPLSLAAIEEALIMGDIPTKVETAFRVLDGLGVTGKHAILTVESGQTGSSFEEFRASITKRVVHRDQTAETTDAPAGEPAGAGALPGELVEEDAAADRAEGDPPAEPASGGVDHGGADR